MFSITVDHLSKAGLLLSSSPRGVGRVGKPKLASEYNKEKGTIDEL
jgi:hypothetical protein